MKKLFPTLLSLTALVIILSFCIGCKKDPVTPPPPPPTTYTVSYDANGGSGSTASSSAVTTGTTITLAASGFTYAGYTFTGWNTASNGSGTSYAAGASYTVTSNVTLYAIWQPAYTAVISSTGTYDASGTAVDKVLLGRSVAKALVLNVTTAGTAKIDIIGSLNNNNPALAYYWIKNTDNTDLNAATSTLGVTKVAITTSSFIVNLNAGVNVICFKTAAYSGSITNGAQVGLKVTASNNYTLANASYTADAVSGNVAAVQTMKFEGANNSVVPSNTEEPNTSWGQIQLTPFSDENVTVYDGTLYPKILGLTLSTIADWSTGTTTGWSSLDFTNAKGTKGQYFDLKQFNSTSGITIIFQNSNAVFSSNTLQFQLTTGFQITKSSLGNYAFMVLDLNVFNNASTQFGPASVSFVYKSVHYAGNPETWVYNTAGVRVQ